jgi:hypothetical protein
MDTYINNTQKVQNMGIKNMFKAMIDGIGARNKMPTKSEVELGRAETYYLEELGNVFMSMMRRFLETGGEVEQKEIAKLLPYIHEHYLRLGGLLKGLVPRSENKTKPRNYFVFSLFFTSKFENEDVFKAYRRTRALYFKSIKKEEELYKARITSTKARAESNQAEIDYLEASGKIFMFILREILKDGKKKKQKEVIDLLPNVHEHYLCLRDLLKNLIPVDGNEDILETYEDAYIAFYFKNAEKTWFHDN